MQSSLLRVAVALITFSLGVSATMFWIAYRTPDVERLKTTACHMRSLLPLPPAMSAEEPLPPPPPAPPRFAHLPMSGGIINGKALSKPAPVYPSAAVASNASGMVAVRVLVDESGRVSQANALSGHRLLHEAAVDAALQARFAPTLLGGQPVKVSGTLTYNFVLP